MRRLKATSEEIAQYIKTLDETPRRLESCSAGIDEARLKTFPEARLARR